MTKLICKIFGHKFSAVALTMFQIEISALNRASRLEPSIMCQRCRAVFTAKELL